MKRAWLFLAPGFEEVEALTPWDVLKRAGVEVTAWSLAGGPVRGRSGIAVLPDKDWNAGIFPAELPEPDLIVLPGGQPGSRNLAADPALKAAVTAHRQKGRPVGAICAAPAVVLGGWGLLKGYHFTGFPGTENAAGPEAKPQTKEVVEDRGLITSRGLGTALPFALALVRHLLGADKAREIAEQVVYAPGS